MDGGPKKSQFSKNHSSSSISPSSQCIIDKQPLLFNNLIAGIENNTDNNMTSLAVDKSIVVAELDNLSHPTDDSTSMVSIKDNHNNSHII